MAGRLKSGYTTGACAAAAAKAAALLLVGERVDTVEIPFPDGSRHAFPVRELSREGDHARASIVKDAGDDPDVTNGAEIVARARLNEKATGGSVHGPRGIVRLRAGEGVGTVTKNGLAVSRGEPAINPMPRHMIEEAVLEAVAGGVAEKIELTISIPRGRELAGKTLNSRLGILGGLSILGTTGIVRPVSAAAWTATIKASLDVAFEAGLPEVVLATGRTSEKAVQGLLALCEEAFAMMGDFLQFSLREAAARGFSRIHLAGMWAKIMKAALEIPQTHVKNRVLEVADGARLLTRLGAGGELGRQIASANTAREIYEMLRAAGREDLVRAVCQRARGYAEKTAGVRVHVYLVDSGGKVVADV